MSSFVISKREYIKAAGIVAGIVAVSQLPGRNGREVWIYDHAAGRNMTDEDYRRQFAACYELNARSVAEQYGDEEPEHDSGDYLPEYNAAYHYAYNTFCSMYGREIIAASLREFFQSALYQTENPEYESSMRYFFNLVSTEIDRNFFDREDYRRGAWGKIPVPGLDDDAGEALPF